MEKAIITNSKHLTQTTMKLIHENKFAIRQTRDAVNRGLLAAKEIVYNLDVLPLNGITSMDSIRELITNHRKFFIKNLPGTDGELFGVPVSPEKAFDLLEMENIDQVIELLKKANKNDILAYLEVGFLDESGFLQIDEEKLERILDKHRTYARTEDQLEFLEAYEELIDAVRKMINLGVPRNTFMGQPGRYFLSDNGTTIEINHRFYKTHV
jgi:hypothetical protein